LIVDKKVEKDFTDLLQERAAKMKVGDGLLPDTDMGPVINEAAVKKVHEYTEIGKKDHARLVHGGEFAGTDGWFYRPTIFADGRKEMRMAQEEIFGPSTLVMPVSGLQEALDVANSTQYGLSMSIYTNDLRKAFHAMDEMQSGIVYVNAPTIGAEIQLPFGGVKNTGNGPSRGGHRGPGRVHGVEDDLRRLQRPAPAGPDRHGGIVPSRSRPTRFTSSTLGSGRSGTSTRDPAIRCSCAMASSGRSRIFIPGPRRSRGTAES